MDRAANVLEVNFEFGVEEQVVGKSSHCSCSGDQLAASFVKESILVPRVFFHGLH
jgi:hypothetical protein